MEDDFVFIQPCCVPCFFFQLLAMSLHCGGHNWKLPPILPMLLPVDGLSAGLIDLWQAKKPVCITHDVKTHYTAVPLWIINDILWCFIMIWIMMWLESKIWHVWVPWELPQRVWDCTRAAKLLNVKDQRDFTWRTTIVLVTTVIEAASTRRCLATSSFHRWYTWWDQLQIQIQVYNAVRPLTCGTAMDRQSDNTARPLSAQTITHGRCYDITRSRVDNGIKTSRRINLIRHYNVHEFRFVFRMCDTRNLL